MTRPSHRSWPRFAATLLLAGFCAGLGQTQDPSLDPEYGTLNLKADFNPDPVEVKLQAGGEVETNLGGIKHWVAKKPDVRLNYTAGKYILSILVESEGDATLLINLPNGKWIANHKGLNGKSPILRFDPPLTGQYDIFVGTTQPNVFPAAKLIVTEKKIP